MRILFVCTGNLCRSPIAENLLKKTLASALRVGVDDLGSRGWIIESAGTHAEDGVDMPQFSKQALEELGMPDVRHSSRLLRAKHLLAADLVFATARQHMTHMMESTPEIWKLRMMDAARDVEDPMGKDLDAHRASASHILASVYTIAMRLMAPAGG